MEEAEEKYTIQQLYEDLPITLIELGERADLNEVTVARIRDGKATRRTSVNKLLRVLSEIYGKSFSVRNVEGINVQHNRREEKREARKQQGPQTEADSAA